MLCVRRQGKPDAKVPYMPDMLACDFLAKVLAPHLGLTLDRKQISVMQNIHCANNSFAFTYANRLRKIGDVMGPDTALFAFPLFAFQHSLVGNASRANLEIECPICLNVHTNFFLECSHCFHDVCLGGWTEHTCPLCRAPFSVTDKTRLHMAILDAVSGGHIETTNKIALHVLNSPLRVHYRQKNSTGYHNF